MAAQLTGYKAEFAGRLDRGLASRLRPKGRLLLTQLCRDSGFSRNTLHAWRTGSQGFGLPALLVLEQACAAAGLPGLYDDVVAARGGVWKAERLPLETLGSGIQRDFLTAFSGGADAVELVANMGLMPHATLLATEGQDFISQHVGSALPVDRSVLGRPVLDRHDRDYARLVQAHLETSRGSPTLYRLQGPGHSYTRLAVPAARLIVTLPFDAESPDGWRVRA